MRPRETWRTRGLRRGGVFKGEDRMLGRGNMMGYGNIDQNTAGIHFRLRTRTFIIAESSQGARFAFVNLDEGMASQLVTIKVLERLKIRFGDLYTQENLAISGTHTHAGPAGYLQYVVYSVISLGFINQTFDTTVTAIEESIIQAHNNLKPGSIFLNTGDVVNAGINRVRVHTCSTHQKKGLDTLATSIRR
ncbi:hypothetical protein F3Y22_tig00111715pilonHSYRG00021 [Hibiscus syriacus]|uniref:Neutral/alkaline non-lysosomal ceramidase N-terminal domain-containing protein n=1 Tax=Hibiscus syriacus TaxID=106335 RepID=A0A6A2YAW3_HIBSY|nr:hypothetical protein F3Y22_tig00111715pilonHSYRG00021 [Hibiscus syriacus]